MQACIRMSNHINQFTCLAYIVTRVHPLQVAVLLCPLHDRVQYLSFKPKMSRSKHKSSGDVLLTGASCYTVPLYFTKYCTVSFKMFIFLCLFSFKYLFEKQLITAAFIGLRNVLSGWNSFICRGLTVIDQLNSLYMILQVIKQSF